MKTLLAALTVGIFAVSSTFAQCGGCEGKKDDAKKEGKKETATLNVQL